MALPKCLQNTLSIPVIGAPLFIVSNPDLVIAQCKAGIVGAFPALNARPKEKLDDWLQKINDEKSKKRIVEVHSMISKDAISLLIANDIKAIKNDQIDNPAPIIKNETVLKKSSSNNSFSNSINIKKFGVETLLHKKMESDRIFEENLEDERSELLYMMNAQKKLFQQVTKKKAPLSISKILKSPIIFAYYTTAILAAILLI